MTFLDAVRTCRKEKDMGFDDAIVFVYLHFKRTGREVPETFSAMAERRISMVETMKARAI